MVTPSSPHIAVVGNVLKINCSAVGLPIPTVQWFRNGVAVTPIALKSLEHSETPVRTMRNVVFTCAAKNYAGNMTQNIHENIIVNIIGKECYMMLQFLVISVFPHIEMKCRRLPKAPANGKRRRLLIEGIQSIRFKCNPGYSTMEKKLTMCIMENGITQLQSVKKTDQ